jgi:hypothetical protein
MGRIKRIAVSLIHFIPFQSSSSSELSRELELENKLNVFYPRNKFRNEDSNTFKSNSIFSKVSKFSIMVKEKLFRTNHPPENYDRIDRFIVDTIPKTNYPKENVLSHKRFERVPMPVQSVPMDKIELGHQFSRFLSNYTSNTIHALSSSVGYILSHSYFNEIPVDNSKFIHANGTELTGTSMSNLVEAGKEILQESVINVRDTVINSIPKVNNIFNKSIESAKLKQFFWPWDIYFRAEIPFFETKITTDIMVKDSPVTEIDSLVSDFEKKESEFDSITQSKEIIDTIPPKIFERYFPIASFFLRQFRSIPPRFSIEQKNKTVDKMPKALKTAGSI